MLIVDKSRFTINHAFFYLVILIILKFLVAKTLNLFSEENFSNSDNDVVFIIIIAPVVETLLIQVLIIEMVSWFFKTNRYSDLISIIFSASIFYFIHNRYDMISINYAVSGILYASYYLIIKRNYKYPFLLTFISHALYNSVIYLDNNFFEH